MTFQFLVKMSILLTHVSVHTRSESIVSIFVKLLSHLNIEYQKNCGYLPVGSKETNFV